MTNTTRSLLAIATLALVAAVSMPASAQVGGGEALPGGRGGAAQGGRGGGRGAQPAGPVPRRADGKPDFTGTWNGSGGALTHTAIIEEHPGGFGILAGHSLIIDPKNGIIPYKPWALAERERRRLDTNGYEDPASHCESYGIARQHQFNWDISYSGNLLIIDGGIQHVTRIIDMTRKQFIPSAIRPWKGDTIARWDGDTLVLESANFNGRPWMDFGDFHGPNAKITERMTMKDSNTFEWTMTIDDPDTFTQPWTMTSAAPFTRRSARPNVGYFGSEDSCHEGNIDLIHLQEVYEQEHKMKVPMKPKVSEDPGTR